MKNELNRFFILFLAAISSFVVLFAFFGPKSKKINLKELSFFTTDSSELYFKNVRSYYYDKEEREDANYILYRIDSRELDTNSNKLNFVLINNWLQDESYIMAESNFVDVLNDDLQLKFVTEDVTDTISLKAKDNEAHYIFAAELYEALVLKADLFLLQKNKELAFLEQEKLSLKTTLKDYFKLVGKLR